MDQVLKNVIDIIVEIAHPDKIILFGSRANATAGKQSDYDLLVLKKGIKNRRELTQNIYRNFSDVGAPIDLIVEETGRFEEKKSDPYLIYKTVAEEGKVVYEGS